MKPKRQDWQTPQGLALLRGWAREDLPMEEIDQALDQSRELADRVMEDALYQRATGYTTTVEKQVKCKQVDYDPDTGKKLREWEEMRPVQEQVHVPGNMTALQFWLKNRKPDCWQQSPAAEPAGEEVEILDDV